jgi:D-alanyl-D-alanine carboxypeptidase (penicillin-binding protein 5/6)
MWKDAESLLNYGLDEFTSYPVAAAGSVFGTVRVRQGNSRSVKAVTSAPLFVSVPKGVTPQLTTQTEISQPVQAPVHAGQIVGQVVILNGDVPMASVPLPRRSMNSMYFHRDKRQNEEFLCPGCIKDTGT